MNFRPTRLKGSLLLVSLLASAALVSGCFSDGKTGPAGPAGATGATGATGPAGPGVSPIDAANPESCATCHSGVGDNHQAIYNKYDDASKLAMTFDSVSSALQADGTYTVTLNFHITKNGQPFVDGDGLPSLQQKTFYAVGYTPATRVFDDSVNMYDTRHGVGDLVSNLNGSYTLTTPGFSYDPTAAGWNGEIYGYIAQTPLNLEYPAGLGHVTLYDDVASASKAYGNVGDYVSAANVAGCEKCHGTPYRKHGYREAVVAGLPDFASCKVCHFDSRDGHDQAWQQSVNDPVGWATGVSATDPQYNGAFNYKAKLMNDVHMSHAMEFPYPQSMANCATCHAGNLDQVINDTTFKPETCRSCHAITDPDPVDHKYDEAGRAPPLERLWADANVSWHNIGDDCSTCHSQAAGYIGPAFSSLHTGYNDLIYDASGNKYSTMPANVVTIDSVSVANNVMDIKFSAGNADIVPTVQVAFYGWNTKNFLVSNHTNDSNGNRLEYKVGSTHPYFTTVANANGSWEVTLDLSAVGSYGPEGTILDMMAAGKIKKAEVAVLPTLKNAQGETLALNAPSKTFDFASDSTVSDYFEGSNAVVDVMETSTPNGGVKGCNTCHDALGTTFHTGDRGGNITVCRMCHVPTSGASHLEMQSRSIDSYVHAIHSFQAFNVGGKPSPYATPVDFTDPVARARYAEHIEFGIPTFTLTDCEACHNAGTYNVPDQSKSMPGALSPSATLYNGWYADDPDHQGLYIAAPASARNITNVPSYVTGPASRACGGCHRAEFIKEDAAGDLASFNQHTNVNGYMIVNDSDDTLYGVIDKIMGMFN